MSCTKSKVFCWRSFFLHCLQGNHHWRVFGCMPWRGASWMTSGARVWVWVVVDSSNGVFVGVAIFVPLFVNSRAIKEFGIFLTLFFFSLSLVLFNWTYFCQLYSQLISQATWQRRPLSLVIMRAQGLISCSTSSSSSSRSQSATFAFTAKPPI